MMILDLDIHIWMIDLKDHKTLHQPYQKILSQKELDIVQNLRSPNAQNQYIISHIALRQILSSYLNCQSNEIPFTYSQYNKPYLTHSENPLKIEFNLSHSENYALCALSTYKRVGVDIEFMNVLPTRDIIAQEILTPFEKEHYNILNDSQKHDYFYTHWTLKESFIKAMGEGISFGFENVGFKHDNKNLYAIDILPYPLESQEWSAQTFVPAPDYIAAISTKQKINNIYHYKWSH